MMKTKKKFTVEVHASTARWLEAFAKANSKTEMHSGKVTVAELLGQAAFCIADAAGRRPGSWEASVGEQMMVSSGYQAATSEEEFRRCLQLDEEENKAARERWNSLTAEQQADEHKFTGEQREKFIADSRQRKARAKPDGTGAAMTDA